MRMVKIVSFMYIYYSKIIKRRLMKRKIRDYSYSDGELQLQFWNGVVLVFEVVENDSYLVGLVGMVIFDNVF